MYISYFNIKKQLDRAETERLKDVNDNIAGKLRAGHPFSEYTRGALSRLPNSIQGCRNKECRVVEKQQYNKDLERTECLLRDLFLQYSWRTVQDILL